MEDFEKYPKLNDIKVINDQIIKELPILKNKIFFAGGCVRDLVTGYKPVKDYDVYFTEDLSKKKFKYKGEKVTLYTYFRMNSYIEHDRSFTNRFTKVSFIKFEYFYGNPQNIIDKYDFDVNQNYIMKIDDYWISRICPRIHSKYATPVKNYIETRTPEFFVRMNHIGLAGYKVKPIHIQQALNCIKDVIVEFNSDIGSLQVRKSHVKVKTIINMTLCTFFAYGLIYKLLN
jgi:hypothetical protein